jgi:hypothetical protein
MVTVWDKHVRQLQILMICFYSHGNHKINVCVQKNYWEEKYTAAIVDWHTELWDLFAD